MVVVEGKEEETSFVGGNLGKKGPVALAAADSPKTAGTIACSRDKQHVWSGSEPESRPRKG